MNAVISSGERVGFIVEGGEILTPSPIFAQVVAVKRGALTVHESESENGLAKIVIHRDSLNSGTYWYEFTRKSGVEASYNVSSLWNSANCSVYVSEFITD